MTHAGDRDDDRDDDCNTRGDRDCAEDLGSPARPTPPMSREQLTLELGQ